MIEQSVRQEIRLCEIDNITFFKGPTETNNEILLNHNNNFHSEIDSIFDELLDIEGSLDSKSECMIELNNKIQSFPKLIKPYLSDNTIDFIFELSSSQPHICCLVYRFFTALMKNFSKDFYQICLNLDIFKNTIISINPLIEHFSYYYILVFLCETIQQKSQSIEHLIECGIVEQLNEMDQNENIDQVLFIYSNIMLEIEENEEEENSSISNVFNYLNKGTITTISNALYYIKKCLQKHNSDYFWKYAIFDERLSFLLNVQNAHIVSNVISCYAIICSYSEEAVSMLLEEKSILDKIFSFIYDAIEQESSDMENQQIFSDNHIITQAVLDLIISMVSVSENAENIAEIYDVFTNFDFPETFQFLNFQCKEKICQIALNLLCKINYNQAAELFDSIFFDSIALIMTTDQEKLEYFDSALNSAKEKFTINEELFDLIDGVQNKYCFDS